MTMLTCLIFCSFGKNHRYEKSCPQYGSIFFVAQDGVVFFSQHFCLTVKVLNISLNTKKIYLHYSTILFTLVLMVWRKCTNKKNGLQKNKCPLIKKSFAINSKFRICSHLRRYIVIFFPPFFFFLNLTD